MVAIRERIARRIDRRKKPEGGSMFHRSRLAGAFASISVFVVWSPHLIASGTIAIGDNHTISVGAGLRTALTIGEDGAPDGKSASTNFNVQSMRLYVDGQIHEKVKFTFNTTCEGCVFGQDTGDSVGAGGNVDILDAIVRIEINPRFNVWAGRMLTPADRIELNGPYYGLSWNQFTVPLLPSDQLGKAGLLGRDDGVTVWGSYGRVQYAAGVFDGVDGGPNQQDHPLFSGRLAINFLDQEHNPGYYNSSTYFGTGGDIMTLGLSFQTQSDGAGTAAQPTDFHGYIVDGLFEKNLGERGTVTVEGEYKVFDTSIKSAARADPGCFCLFDGDAWFVTAAYLLPNEIGIGKLQPYIRFTSNNPDGRVRDSDLTEFGVNYVVKGHNLRFNANVTTGDANLTGAPGNDKVSFLLGVQVQI